MLVVGFPSGAMRANCYVLADHEGGTCVIVDPGQDAVEQIENTLRLRRLTPVAMLATHGHLDHVFSATEVGDRHNIPLWIHPGDRSLLAEPFVGVHADRATAFADGLEMTEPRLIRDITSNELCLANLRILVEHTPGHTQGSVIFRLQSDAGGRVVVTGDTLFAGSIGRTDLPGGSASDIAQSLRRSLLPLDDETVVLPGHGESTTMGRERRSNPYLARVGLGGG